MVGSLLANMVLPAPGGPIKIALCPPAAAISSARLIFSWPLTSEKSRSKFLWADANSSRVSTTVGFLYFKKLNYFVDVFYAIHF